MHLSALRSNIKNRTIFCRDNLDILQGINSTSIDLIYLDPPFNKKKVFTASIGSSAEGAYFKDYFRAEAIKEEWVQTIKAHKALHNFLSGVKLMGKGAHYKYNYCYLCYLAIRLLELRRVLKETGSLYLHCDPTMSHYLKLLLDLIFGEKNFRNEIIWKKTNSPKPQSKSLGKQHDIILFYSKGKHFTFNKIYQKLDEKALLPYSYRDEKGKFRLIEIIARGGQNYQGRKQFNFKGVTRPWLYNLKQLNEWWNKALIYKTKNGNYNKKQYLKEREGKVISDLFVDNEVNPIQGSSKEYTGYPTQKPLALLKRIIKASSNKGDLVLDPFCGSATTCIASEKLDRQWVGIDVSLETYHQVKRRLTEETEGNFDFTPTTGRAPKSGGLKVYYTHTPPQRTDSARADWALKK